MIAIRPLHGKIGPMTYTILEGRKISPQILKLLDVKKLLKDGVIEEEKKPVKKIFKEDMDN